MRAAVACLALALATTAPAAEPQPEPRTQAEAEPEPRAQTEPEPEPHGPAEPTAKAASKEAKQQGSRWFALPVIFYLPETSLGFGVTGGFHYHVGEAARPSSIFAAVVYTLDRQGSVNLASDVQLPGGAAVTARFRAQHYPDVFFGIGPSTPESAKEDFTRRTIDGYVIGELPVLGQRLRAGPRIDYRVEGISDIQPGGELASGTVQGTNGFAGFGVGASATYDTRDSSFWPLRGTYGEGFVSWYPTLGSQPGFTHGLLEGRRFLPLGGGRVLGLAAFTEWTAGNPPFTVLPSLGSTRFLRGYRGGRFRDRIAWSGQTELRLPVKGPLSAAVFLGVGDVAHTVSSLTLSTIKVAGGAGLRWRLTREGANIRADIAAGAEGVEYYLLVLEAF
jgi:hypothetical protein